MIKISSLAKGKPILCNLFSNFETRFLLSDINLFAYQKQMTVK